MPVATWTGNSDDTELLTAMETVKRTWGINGSLIERQLILSKPLRTFFSTPALQVLISIQQNDYLGGLTHRRERRPLGCVAGDSAKTGQWVLG